MNNTNKLWIVAGALAATTAVGYAQFRTQDTSGALSSKTGQAFLQALGDLQQDYLKPVDRDKLLQGAIKGMAGSLNDKFVYYFPPEDAGMQDEDLKGEFFGIGALIGSAGTDGNGAQIQGVYKDQPAARAGLQAGDKILKVNGEDVSQLNFQKVVSKIRGPNGTVVKLELGRGNSTYTANITRSPITIVSVETATLPGNVGYVALNTFANEKVFQQFSDAVNAFEKKGVTKLVLDLRDNGGGLLNAGIFVADKFLQQGPIVSLRARDQKPEVVGSAKKQADDYTGKLVVLINANSASASEIVAGALQDYNRATVVGEKSFGKGVAQSIDKLPDGSQLWIVSNEWLTPKGRGIQDKGIVPDVKVADTRYPTPISLSGLGLTPNQKVTVTLGGRTLDLNADKDGKLSFTETPKRPPTSGVQGEAVVNPKTDAELARALDILNK